METIQENKIIAEFMELEKTVGGGGIVTYYLKDNYPEPNPLYFYSGTYNYTKRMASWFSSNLKYHSSWDWIMPVVEDVKEICTVDQWWLIADALLSGDIQKLWTELVTIIECYNNQQTPQVSDTEKLNNL